MKFKIILEYITIIFISLFAFLSFCFIFIYLAKFSFGWYIFEHVAESFYYRILAILFGGILLFSCVNFIINISLFTKTYYLKSAGILESQISFDSRKILIKTFIISTAIVTLILSFLFILNVSNKHDFQNMYKNKFISIIDNNKKIINNILEKFIAKSNAQQIYVDLKSLKTEDYKISILVPIIDNNKKYHYRFIEKPSIPSDENKKITKAMAFNDFYNLESKYFDNHTPTSDESEVLNEISKNKINKPYLLSSRDNFIYYYPIFSKDKKIFIILSSGSTYFGENKYIFYNF